MLPLSLPSPTIFLSHSRPLGYEGFGGKHLYIGSCSLPFFWTKKYRFKTVYHSGLKEPDRGMGTSLSELSVWVSFCQ